MDNGLLFIAGLIIAVGGIVMIVLSSSINTLFVSDQNVKRSKELQKTLLLVFGCLALALGCVLGGIGWFGLPKRK
jgi:uncharacterized membrane protein